MVAHISTLSFIGIDATEVEVQVQICPGIATFNIVGMANKAISESKERIRAAFASIGLSIPMKRVTVNLSPADVLKEGSHFDLAIAAGLLVEMGSIAQEELSNFIVMGELCLDGRITRVAGVLPAAIKANAKGFGLLCPKDNIKEARWSGNDSILAIGNLIEMVNHFNGRGPIDYLRREEIEIESERKIPDMQDIKGQEFAKRALEVAAAGRHHMLMIGPPGSGKSMLAKRLAGIMPKLNNNERLELSIIASLAGEISDLGLVEHRPFREPHSSASMAAVVGGGRNAKPGEVTLAHKGVLFMDELPEFSRNVLESLRQPVESKTITVSRVNNHVTYPANFQLIAAMNPCKCGYFGTSKSSCSKVPKCAEEYQNRISGPLFDRFDLQVEVPEENAITISRGKIGEDSKTVADRVNQAVMIQNARYKDSGIASNAELEGEILQEVAKLDSESQKLMEEAVNKFSLSMRSFNKVLRVSRTIADLDTSEFINKFHVSEALSYRISRIRA